MFYSFSLQPFRTEAMSTDFRINGSITGNLPRLKLLYELEGPLENLAIPKVSDKPRRKDRLWEETCFELFLNPADSDAYWEFNLSPSGDWNAYRFDAYRKGMCEQMAFVDLPSKICTTPKILNIAVDLDLDGIIPADRVIDVGISAILKSVGGNSMYWALSHHGAEPDFHRRDGFTIKIR